MNHLHGQRGQTFPIWAFGTLTVLVMLTLALSYGQMITWQIRASNAADAAARGMLAVQTSQWNQEEATLHAAAVEEYRLRNITQDLLEVIRGNGGCTTGSGATSCSTIYSTLRQAYLDSLTRYTNDVVIMGRISTPSFTTQVQQIGAALAQYQANCGQPNGGDCSFDYTLVGATPRNNSFLEDVYSDCCAWTVGGGTSGNPKEDLDPMEIEVVACSTVSPWVPNFWNWSTPAFNVVGRAAATSIMDTQEFMWVGSLVNPDSLTSAVFQPTEYPESSSDSAIFSSNDDKYYRIDYGGNPNDPNNNGNPATSNGVAAFFYTASNPGLEAADGFWSAMAIKPFSGNLTAGTNFSCAAN